MNGVHWRETTREAWRNIWGGTTHAVRWALILAGAVGALAWVETATVAGQVNDAARYLTQGGATWTMQSPNGISGLACDALARADGVVAAGAVARQENEIVTTGLPRAPITSYAVTPGFPLLVAAEANGSVLSEGTEEASDQPVSGESGSGESGSSQSEAADDVGELGTADDAGESGPDGVEDPVGQTGSGEVRSEGSSSGGAGLGESGPGDSRTTGDADEPGDEAVLPAELSGSEMPGVFIEQTETMRPTGLVVSGLVAERFDLVTPSTLSTTVGQLTITGVYDYPEDGRRSEYGYALLEPTYVDQVFDECWVTVWPTDESITTLLYTTLLPQTDPMMSQNVKLGQLNSRYAATLDAVTIYSERLTRWAPLAAAVIGLMLGAVAVWMRRLELASNRHAGLTCGFLVGQLLQECAAWAAMAAIGCLPIVIGAAWGCLADTTQVWLTGVRVVVAGCTAPLIGATLAACLIREKQLFVLFKNR